MAWNGLTLVRPADDPAVERPQHWVKASVADTEIGESAGGTFTVSLSEPARSDVEAAWSLEGAASGTATVAKGASSVDIPVKVEDDALDEDDEDVAFHITSVSDGLQVERSTAVGTVVDDDAVPALSIAGTKIAEGAWSLTDVALQVTLSAKSGKDVEVSYATADGTAKAPGDYTTGGGRVFIPAGQTTAVAHVAANGDTEFEQNEASRCGSTSSAPPSRRGTPAPPRRRSPSRCRRSRPGPR